MYKGIALIVGTVYRPPNCNIVDFDDAMSNILEKIGHHSSFIMGDFNLDLMKHDKHLPTEKIARCYVCQSSHTSHQSSH